MTSEDELKNIKSLIRAVLMSSKAGVEASRLLGDYNEFAGKHLPFKKMGFQDVTSFMRSIPDVARVRMEGNGQTKFYAVADQSTAHIQKLIANQKSSKKLKKTLPKHSSRRPSRPVGTGQPRLPQPHRPPLLGRYPGDPNHRPSLPFKGNKPCSQYHQAPPSPPSVFNYRVTVGGATGGRAVNQTRRTIPRAFGDGSYRNPNALMGPPHQGKSRTNYQVPPRFQRKENRPKLVAVVSPNKAECWNVSSPESPEIQRPFEGKSECWDVSSPESPELERPVVGKWCDEPFESYDYLELLEQYCDIHNVDVKFSVKKTKIVGETGYLCVIHIHEKAVGSINVLETELLAKEEAAKNVCKQFNINHENKHRKWSETSYENKTSGSSGIQVPAHIKENIKKLLSTVEVSMWATRFPVAYKEKFRDQPENLLEMVRACPGIARFEMMKAVNREVIIPVREEKKSTQVITEPSTPAVSAAAPVPASAAAPAPAAAPAEPKYVGTKVAPQQPIPPQNPFEGVIIPPPEPIGDESVVYMSFAESCHNFCVQFETSCCEEIDAQLARLCPNLTKPNPVFIKTGVFCSALYSTDQQWYRAEIMSDKDNNIVKVRFVDYGDAVDTNVENIRPLPADVSDMPQQAIYCSLYGVQPIDGVEWSSRSLEILGEFARDKRLIAISVVNNGLYEEVELYQADEREKSLNNLLIEMKEAYRSVIVEKMMPDLEKGPDEPDDVALPNERFLDVYVSSINYDLDMVVRIVGNDYSEKLEELEAYLETYYNSCRTGQEIKAGMVCVACIETLYHRVKVCSIQGDQAECYILDHGDIETVDLNLLRPLDPQVNRSLPYQAMKMELYGLSPMMYETTTQEKLIDMAIGKICVAEIMAREEKICAVLFDLQDEEININEHIVKILISEGHTLDLNIFDSSIGPNTPSDTQSLASNEESDGIPVFVPKTNNVTQNAVAPFTAGKESGNIVDPALNGSSIGRGSTNTGSAVSLPPSSSSVDHKAVSEALATSLTDLSITSDNSTAVSQSSVISDSDKSSNSSLYTWGLATGGQRQTSTPTNEMTAPPVQLTNNIQPLSTLSTEQSVPLKMPPNIEIPPVGELLAIQVVWLCDPSNFACVPQEIQESFKEFSEKLNDHYAKNVLEEEEPVIGEVYAAKINEIYYRVIVKDIVEEQYSVYLPDYAQYCILEKDDFQPLRKQFYSFPFVAFHAKLHGVTHVGETWSESAKYIAMQMAESSSLYALICGKGNDGVVSVKIIDTSDEVKDVCLDELLVSLNYARHI